MGGLAWRAKQLRQALAGAAQLLTPSAFVRDWYISQGIPAGLIQVCELGVERPPSGWVAAPRPPGSPLRFLYLGGIAPHKGVHVIIEALRGVQGAAELWVAGDLVADATYSRRLREIATPQTRFLGRLARDQVWTALGQVDVVLAPSLWYETYCLAAREAQVAGVPVIAAHTGALAEAVQPEVNGLLAPAGDVAAWQAAMQRCVAEPALLAGWRANSPAPPTVAAHVAKVAAVYQSIMTQGRS
jgi:glycosyltransferase involved in cell wall biosynthesis